MANTQTINYVLNANAQGLMSALQASESAALSLEGALKNASMAFGIGYGITTIAGAIKEAVQEFADYEQSLLRIKNASTELSQGLLNQNFIFQEAFKYRIPIEEATDAYGKFLAMIGNSGIASSQVRQLHDNVLEITKVLALPQSKMDIAVRDVGKMLGEGILESRSLHGLERVMPQITSFLAENLGVNRQELSASMSSGALTRSAIDSKILLDVFQQYADSLNGGLVSSLNTTQSAINQLHNDWFTFTTDITTKFKPEIIGMFNALSDGLHWLKENEDGIMRLINSIGTAIIAWAGYKTAISLAGFVQRTFFADVASNVAGIASETSAISSLNFQLEILNANLEAFIALQTQATAATMTFADLRAIAASQTAIANLPINMAGTAGVANNVLSGIGSGLIQGATSVFIVGMAAQVIGEMAGVWAKNKELGIQTNLLDTFLYSGMDESSPVIKARRATTLHDQISNELSKWADAQTNPVLAQFGLNSKKLDPYGNDLYNAIMAIQQKENARGNPTNFEDIYFPKDKFGKRNTTNDYAYDALKTYYSVLPELADREDFERMKRFQQGQSNGESAVVGKKLINPNDKITGQRVITYNINIREMNGLKDVKIDGAVNDPKNLKDIGSQVEKVLLDVTNDSQLQTGR